MARYHQGDVSAPYPSIPTHHPSLSYSTLPYPEEKKLGRSRGKPTEKIGVRVVATRHYRGAQVAFRSFFLSFSLCRIYRYPPPIASPPSRRGDHGSIYGCSRRLYARDTRSIRNAPMRRKAFTTGALSRDKLYSFSDSSRAVRRFVSGVFIWKYRGSLVCKYLHLRTYRPGPE